MGLVDFEDLLKVDARVTRSLILIGNLNACSYSCCKKTFRPHPGQPTDQQML